MRAKRFRRLFPSFVIGISITALVVLFFLITEKLSALREAPGDNVTWTLSQLEVDLLHLLDAGKDALVAEEPDLQEVRRRFNNVYSRASGIAQAPVFAIMRQDEDFTLGLSEVRSRLDSLVPLIDGADEALQGGLPAMLATLAELGEDVRGLAISGISIQSQSSDLERQSFSQLLWLAVGITVALIFFLVVMSYLQLRQHRAFRRISTSADRANTRLKSSFEVSLDAIVVADDSGIILEFNDAAEQVFGYSRQEAIGAQMADLIIPHHMRAAHHAGMERFNRTKEPKLVGQGRIEVTALRKSGEEFPVEISIGQTQDRNGTIFISYLRDITERLEAESDLKQARDDALQAERAKSNFLAVMSHEMRTPLNGIFGTIELLNKTPLRKDQKKYLDIAQRSGDILLHHVNDVLDITRIDAGELELVEHAFDLANFFEDAIKTNEPAALQSGNALHLDTSGITHKWVWGDEQRLRQIVFNLISNAFKFTDKGNVTVAAKTAKIGQGVTLVFDVSDTGVGISEADQEKIFERFFTQEKSYDRMASGAGLGLAICKQIASQMGGTIAVQSALGQGSTFSVSIPLAVAEAPSQSSDAHSPASKGLELQGHHVLLVEDNEINRTIVREMLELSGAHVSEAHNGLEAIEAASASAYSAILMDISMPKMNGVDATLQIRAGTSANRSTPIVALTAHALKEEQERFLEAGMNACLNKPVSQADLVHGLSEVLGLGTMEQEAATAATDACLLDPDIFGNLKTVLNSEKLSRLVHKFDAEIGTLLDVLPGQMAEEHFENLASVSHRSVGSAGMIGLLSYQEDLRALENAARSGEAKAVEAAAETVRQNWPETREALMASL